ncbi:hypothetical protein LM602_00460 [Candidatus Acetothermia bacterium]|jgi:hypothetical protein|nr:hypothetical protein [Candidatus Acetothermia bacterium]MCI2431020.1 hypothetical protein [Candidatus Acetothermia bacterium]MCI2436916.1 hypothetical protein [Candidatus Acetothermia bacterium]
MRAKRDETKEFFARNHELSLEFSRYILEHPELDDQIAPDAVIVFLPDFDEPLKAFNLKMGKELEQEGQRVVYLRVKELAPVRISRLIGVEIGN